MADKTLIERIGDCPIAAKLPPHMLQGLERYVDHKIKGGSFLHAALSNDLKEAAGQADDTNKRLLWEYCYVFYNHIPLGAWGSPENVQQWLSSKAVTDG